MERELHKKNITGNHTQVLGHGNQNVVMENSTMTNSNNRDIGNAGRDINQSATCSGNGKVYQIIGDNATVNIESTNTAYLLNIIAEQSRIIDRLTMLLEKTNTLALQNK